MKEIPYVKEEAPEEERRALGRIDGRIDDGVSVELHWDGAAFDCIIIDFSAMGLGLESRAPALLEREPPPGTEVEVDFRVSRLQTEGLLLRCRVTEARPLDDALRIGLIVLPLEDQVEREARIESKTLKLPSRLRLVGLLDDPLQFDQTCLVLVRRISRKYFVLRNSDPTLAVFPSMPVRFRLNLFGENHPITGHVRWVRWSKTATAVSFAVKIDEMSAATDRSIVRYVMRFLDWPPFVFKRAGMDTGNIKDIVQFRFVRTQQEYVQVLELRRRAYASARKMKRESELGDLSSEHDEHSRILTAWHHGTLVGSVAVLFGNARDIPFEIQKQLGDEAFRKAFPGADRFLEVSALCLHHDYRKSDILNGFFERLFQMLISRHRTRIIAACDKYLWPIYESIGFRKTGLNYVARKRTVFPVDVIQIKAKDVAVGRGMDPARWKEVYGPMAEHLEQTGIFAHED